MTIASFTEEYRFLSNFYPCIIEHEGLIYPSVECAYQASKSIDLTARGPFTIMNPVQAKKAGKKLVIRSDWNTIKYMIMYKLVKQKFNNPELKKLLLLTTPHELIEGNWWGDTYWGVCHGIGQNNLGKILMEVRTTLKEPYVGV